MINIHPIISTCIAVLALLIFGGGLVVSIARGHSNIGIGQASDHNHILNRLIRAHGNTAEYVPAFAILFLIHGLRQPSTLVLSLVVAATAARVVFIIGMLTSRTLSRPSLLRALGAIGTYISGLWLAILVLLGA